MSRAAKIPEKGAHKRKFCRSWSIFPSAWLGDAEIPYSLSHLWRTINETLGGENSHTVLLRSTLLRFSFFS